MNCDEFDKKLMEDPYNSDAGFHQHLAECDHCRARFEDVMQLEKKISDALDSGPDEEFLKNLEQQVLHAVRKEKRKNRRILATAAGVVLMIAGSMPAYHFYKIRSLSDFVLAHIEHEIEQLESTVKVSQANLEYYFDKFDSGYLNALQDFTYVRKCWMRTGYGLHLIHRGQNGPVTLLFMPNEQVASHLPVRSERFQGKVYPLAKGSLAIVGEQGEPVELLAETVRMAM